MCVYMSGTNVRLFNFGYICKRVQNMMKVRNTFLHLYFKLPHHALQEVLTIYLQHEVQKSQDLILSLNNY